jgi:quercetin dioxygenase-like cupin family protein
MQKHNLNQLLEYDDERFRPKMLLNEPGYRMMLLNMRAGQSIREHAVQGIVTAYAILGHVSLYAGPCPCDLHAGELVCIESGLPHRVEAQEDSALLVLIADGDGSSLDGGEELDLREIRRSEHRPLVFHKFEMLGRSFTLTNDRDRAPISRQMNDMRPGQFGWEHIQRSPDIDA